MAEHEPEVLARATQRDAAARLPHVAAAPARHVTDRGDASGTGWFDAATGDYLCDLFKAATDGTWDGALPTVLGPTEAAGTLTADAAAALGLPIEVVVGPGSGDNMGAALGLGLRSGDVAMSLGTSGTVFAVSATPTRDVGGAVAGFASASGSFLPLVCTLNATKVTDTVARWLGIDAPGLADARARRRRRPGITDAGAVLRRRAHPEPARRHRHVRRAHEHHHARAARARRPRRRAVRVARRAGRTPRGRRLDATDGCSSWAVAPARPPIASAPPTSAGPRSRCPYTDETVAIGAAAQAAAVCSGDELGAVAERWSLGAGDVIEPRHDAAGVRERYAARR